MEHHYFKSLEHLGDGAELRLTEVIDNIVFDDRGLLPVITQDSETKEILMFAWMNKEALQRTLSSKRMTYWSRSRQEYWVKGQTSGHTQALMNMSFDCDGDVALCQVKQEGKACHTGRRDCFYLQVDHPNQRVLIKGEANFT